MKPMDERGEFLVSEGYQIKKAIATLQTKLRLLEDELDAYFCKETQVESLSTEAGSAHRVLQEDVYIAPDQVATVMELLRSQFPEYFTTTLCCRPTPKCLDILLNADAPLTRELRPYIVIKRERHMAFSPGRRIIDVELGARP